MTKPQTIPPILLAMLIMSSAWGVVQIPKAMGREGDTDPPAKQENPPKPDDGSISLSSTKTEVIVGQKIILTASIQLAEHKNSNDDIETCDLSTISVSFSRGTKTQTVQAGGGVAKAEWTPTPNDVNGDITITASVSASCGNYDPNMDSVTVKQPEIVQFNPKPSKFPKCKNQDISREDFVIVTNPTNVKSSVVISLPDGTTKAGKLTASASLNGKSKNTAYQVLDPGDSGIELPPLSDISLSKSNYMEIIGGGHGSYKEGEFSASMSGSPSYSKPAADSTPWSGCGDGISISQSQQVQSGWTVSTSIGANLAGIFQAQVGTQYNISTATSKTVTFSHPAEPENRSSSEFTKSIFI